MAAGGTDAESDNVNDYASDNDDGVKMTEGDDNDDGDDDEDDENDDGEDDE